MRKYEACNKSVSPLDIKLKLPINILIRERKIYFVTKGEVLYLFYVIAFYCLK